MSSLEISQLSVVRKAFVIPGIALLVVSALVLSSILLGVFELQQFEVLGHSGLRTIAAIAVLGCILAAIGYYEE